MTQSPTPQNPMPSQSTLVEERPKHRATLTRRALLLTPSAIVSTGLLLFAISNLPSSIFAVIIVGLMAIALDMEAIAALRDLRAQPVTTQGRVSRLWKKSRYIMFGRVDYMLVDRNLFEVNAITATELRVDDQVIVEHWPYSHVVISIARVRPDAGPPALGFGEPKRP